MLGYNDDDEILSDSEADEMGVGFPDEGHDGSASSLVGTGASASFPEESNLNLSLGLGVGNSSRSGGAADISDNREDQFERSTGRFRGSDGEFEPGAPPPDYDRRSRRFRGQSGRYKDQSNDLYDEEAEVRKGSLDPPG